MKIDQERLLRGSNNIEFYANAQPDHLALPQHVIKLKFTFEKLVFIKLIVLSNLADMYIRMY